MHFAAIADCGLLYLAAIHDADASLSQQCCKICFQPTAIELITCHGQKVTGTQLIGVCKIGLVAAIKEKSESKFFAD